MVLILGSLHLVFGNVCYQILVGDQTYSGAYIVKR